MKAHSLTIYSIVMAITVSTLTLTWIHGDPSRSPAQEEIQAEVKSEAKADNDLKNSLCLSKRNEAKLEAQIKEQLKDKEEILKEIDSLKKEMKQKKAVVEAEKPKEEKTPPPVVPATPQAPGLDIVGLMAQITSLLQSQQQNQFQMQTQMISLFSQMQYNLNPPSMLNSLSDNLGGYGIGISSMNPSVNSNALVNPYSQIPSMAPMMRAPIPMGSGFNFSTPPFPPTMGGFNFNQLLEQNAPVITMI